MKFLFSLLLLFLSTQIMAQNNYNPKDFDSKPIWMEMMQDTNVNYFTAQLAYERFWLNKERPFNEDETIGENGVQQLKQTGNIFQRIRAARELKKRKELHDTYFLACKKFEHWLFITKPYVQEDGSILSPHAQQELYEQQRKQSLQK